MEEGIFKFSNLSKFGEIIHGVSERSYGDMRFGRIERKETVKNRQSFFSDLGIDTNQVVVANLCHKARVVVIGEEEKGKGSLKPESAIYQTDGLITAEKDVYLMVTVFDCLPVLAYDPVSQIVMIIHAGWRGIIDKIIPQGLEKIHNFGSDLQNIVVGIGPGICQRHFVVKTDVLDKFVDLYPSASFIRNHNGYVDLRKAILTDLNKAGVPKFNIEVSDICPMCLNGLYGSYRKEGESAPASAAVIGMR